MLFRMLLIRINAIFEVFFNVRRQEIKYKLYIEKKIESHTTWPTKQILQDIPAKSYKFLEIPKF